MKSSPHPSKSPQQLVHFIGIGGIGVSALARYFLSQNWAVSGSDAVKHRITEGLKKASINVKIGHKPGNIPRNASIIVRSQAIPATNPEIREAIRRGIKVVTYPEAIGTLTRQYKTIAVAGSHGKSTTTALAALALIKGRLDPTVIIGNNLRELHDENFRIGKSCYLVLEADEFGRAFLHYSPFVAIVTNIDREHLDIYKNLADAKNAFMKFLGNTQEGGALVLNYDDPNVRSLEARVKALAARKKLKVIWYSAEDASVPKIRRVLKIFGVHNVSNAEAVYRAGRFLGIPEVDILKALGSYRGAWRRMEYRGAVRLAGIAPKALVYDDYAHHPTEIKATLAAMREHFPKNPLICIFQPHQGRRLELLFREFAGAFDDADITVLLPLYKVRGRDEFCPQTSASLAEAMRLRNPSQEVFAVDNGTKLQTHLEHILSMSRFSNTRLSPVVIMMGAGDIVNYTAKFF